MVIGPTDRIVRLLPFPSFAVFTVDPKVAPPVIVIDEPERRSMFAPLVRPLPSVMRRRAPFAWKAVPAFRKILSPFVIPPLNRSMSAGPAMVRVPADCMTTLPLDALAVATRVPPLQDRFRDASNPIDTAVRFTGVVLPIVRS